MTNRNSGIRILRWTTLFSLLICMLLPQIVKAENASLIKDYGIKEYVRVSKDLPHSESNPWKLVCKMPYNTNFFGSSEYALTLTSPADTSAIVGIPKGSFSKLDQIEPHLRNGRFHGETDSDPMKP